MIDEKKIKKEALWHDASEEPKYPSTILVLRKTSEGVPKHFMLLPFLVGEDWRSVARKYNVKHWLYPLDLLPKEGGEE